MDGLVILFAILVIVFFGTIFVMNFLNHARVTNEGFQAPSAIENQIRKILEPMNTPGVCDLYAKFRANMAQNIKAEEGLTPAEVNAKVEKTLAQNIQGGALPCPLLTYPKSGSTDLDWLNFLNNVPPDFGARVVLMVKYANKKLVNTQQTVEAALSGGSAPEEEPFIDICPPNISQVRREEAAKKAVNAKAATCKLPEDMTPAQIQEAVTSLLQNIVSQKIQILTSKKIDPNIDLVPLLAAANKSMAYLETTKNQASDGTLVENSPGLANIPPVVPQ